MDKQEFAPLPTEDESSQKRREVAESFFAQYIDVGEGVTADQVVDALEELISYGGDLDMIIQMMALEQE